jgi:IS30 family transposase
LIACLVEREDKMNHLKGNQKHLTLSQRIEIEKGLNYNRFFAEIAMTLEKDPSTISKEVRKYRAEKAMINHINSEARDSLNGCTPYQLSRLLLNHQLHTSLLLQEIIPDEVTLRPELLK